MDSSRDEDPARSALNTLITLWLAHMQPDVGYTVAQIVARANERRPPELHELLLQQAGTVRGEIDARQVGFWLTASRGRVHKGYCIERVKEHTRFGHKYALVKA
jgi:hypothetical protein